MPAQSVQNRRLLLVVVLWSLAVSFCGAGELRAETCPEAAPDEVLRVTAADNGSRVTLASGVRLELSLNENPTTGYHWQIVALDSEIMQLESSTFKAPQTGLVGAGGQSVWCFRVLKPGSTRLKMSLYRPWEGLDSDVDSFELGIEAVSARQP